MIVGFCWRSWRRWMLLIRILSRLFGGDRIEGSYDLRGANLLDVHRHATDTWTIPNSSGTSWLKRCGHCKDPYQKLAIRFYSLNGFVTRPITQPILNIKTRNFKSRILTVFPLKYLGARIFPAFRALKICFKVEVSKLDNNFVSAPILKINYPSDSRV